MNQELHVPPVIAGRVPPHDLGAEAAVLSAILIEQAAYDDVADLIQHDDEHHAQSDFYSDANRLVYGACRSLSEQGIPIDVVNVATELRAREQIGRIGGAAYLGMLVDASPAVAHLRAHAETVHKLGCVRRAIAVLQRNAAEGYGVLNAQQAEEWIDVCESSVWEVTSTGTAAGDFTPLKTVLTSVFQRMNAKVATGIPVNLVAVDHCMGGVHPGDVLIIGARPGMGKTAFVLQMARQLAQGYVFDAAGNVVQQYQRDHDGEVVVDADGNGVPQLRTVGVFELEMPEEQVGQRLIAQEAAVSVSRIRKPHLLDAGDWKRLTEAAPVIASLPVEIDDTAGITITQLRSKARRLAAKAQKRGQPLCAIIIDYLQLMQGQGGNREQEIAGISRGLKELAKELKVPVIALAQLNRSVETRGGDKRPGLADLRESGAIEQDADAVVFLYRAEYYAKNRKQREEVLEHLKYGAGESELIIAKQRNGPAPMTAPMRFVKHATKFENISGWPGTEHREAA